MADNEIQILIKAQEQTQQAFTQARSEIQKLGQQVQQTNKLLGGLTAGLGALGVAFSATAVIGFAKDILDTAGNINDLSQAMGVSTDAVQDFKSVAEQSGATIDDVGAAINKLNVEAGNGAAGFEKLHLNLAEIQALSPEERFRAVADALQEIKDPAERAAIGQELLGKGYKNLAASIDQGIGSMRDANKMSKETIDTLDSFGDTIVRLGTKTKNFFGEALAKAINTPRDVIREMTADLDRLGIAIDAVVAKAPKIPDAFKGLSRSDVTLPGLNAEEAAQVEEALNKERKALDETAKAADSHAKKIREVQDALFGRTAIAAAKNYLEALGSINNLSKVSDEDQKKLNDAARAAIDAYKRLGETAPAALNQLYVRTVPLPNITEKLADVVKDLGTEAQIAIPKLYDLPKPIDDTTAAIKLLEEHAIKSSLTLKDLIPAAAKETKFSFDALSRSLSELAQVSGTTFGGMVSSLSQIVSAASAAQHSIDLVMHSGDKDASGKGKGFEGILELTTGILGVVAAAIQAGKAIASLFDRNKGRDLIVDFADTLGGFDELHKKLLELGDEGEQLWIRLTQGVGRNNPKEAQAAIDAVTAALDKQSKKQDDATDAPRRARSRRSRPRRRRRGAEDRRRAARDEQGPVVRLGRLGDERYRAGRCVRGCRDGP
jgi:methyl-accepting chemotaxis protein